MQLGRSNKLLNRRLVRGTALVQAGLHRCQAQTAGTNLIDGLLGANEIGNSMLGRTFPVVSILDMQLSVRMQQPALTIAGIAVAVEHFRKRRFAGVRRTKQVIRCARQDTERTLRAWPSAGAYKCQANAGQGFHHAGLDTASQMTVPACTCVM